MRVALLLPALLLAGCAAAAPAGPYEAEFEFAKANATSDFEQDILTDGSISRAEYEEATSRYVECLNSKGYATTRIDQRGIYSYQIEGQAEGVQWEVANETCRLGTVEQVEPLYVDMMINPGNENFVELVIACLKKNGLVEPTFDTDDFLAVETAPPWDPDDPLVNECISRPAG